MNTKDRLGPITTQFPTSPMMQPTQHSITCLCLFKTSAVFSAWGVTCSGLVFPILLSDSYLIQKNPVG